MYGSRPTACQCMDRRRLLKGIIESENNRHDRLFVIDSFVNEAGNEIFTVGLKNNEQQIFGIDKKGRQSMFDFAVNLFNIL